MDVFKNTNVTLHVATEVQQTLLALDLKPRPSQNKQNSKAKGFLPEAPLNHEAEVLVQFTNITMAVLL